MLDVHTPFLTPPVHPGYFQLRMAWWCCVSTGPLRNEAERESYKALVKVTTTTNTTLDIA
jgi:hypothetical protein